MMKKERPEICGEDQKRFPSKSCDILRQNIDTFDQRMLLIVSYLVAIVVAVVGVVVVGMDHHLVRTNAPTLLGWWGDRSRPPLMVVGMSPLFRHSLGTFRSERAGAKRANPRQTQTHPCGTFWTVRAPSGGNLTKMNATNL